MNSVTIVGAGLVGSLMACYLGKQGFNTEVYEQREDIRIMPDIRDKSINMAVSVRGLSALKKLNLDQEFIYKNAIPMKGRLIHNLNKSTKIIPYGKTNQCIYSIGRKKLNEILLNKAQSYSNVKLNFNSKLSKINFDLNEYYFIKNDKNNLNQEIICKKSNFIIGADGAYSAVRNQLIKKGRFYYEQYYIDHGYIELYIPPIINLDKIEFAMKKNYLHIWPRKKFMLIALPNLDKSFTVTLFMPFDNFDSLNTEDKIIQFFELNFSDALLLIGKKELVTTFLKNNPSSLISIKFSPFNFLDKCILIGDAAHAMVPFFGQGMNCGFEDCSILDDLFKEYTNQQLNSENLKIIFNKFNKERNENCKIICELALTNYIEMRHSVNTWNFFIRKNLDSFLNLILGKHWIPLYSMVTFSRISYKKCFDIKQKQDKYLLQFFKFFIFIFIVCFSRIVFKSFN